MYTHHTLSVKELACIKNHQPLFRDLCFEINAGDVLWIEGCNGSGKSSLLRLLTGLATPTVGSIFWSGKSIKHLKTAYWRDLHYLSHTNGIKLGLTVIENLQLAAQLNLYSQPIQEDIFSLLQLNSHKNLQARYLSAGQKRRLALAKLILFPKPLWILDEPFTALDADTQNLFMTHLESHAKNGGMSIVSSHQSIHLNAPIKKLRLPAC